MSGYNLRRRSVRDQEGNEITVSTSYCGRGRPGKNTPKNVSLSFKTDSTAKKLVFVLGDLSSVIPNETPKRISFGDGQNTSGKEKKRKSVYSNIYSDGSDSDSCSSTDSLKIEEIKEKAKEMNDLLNKLIRRKEEKRHKSVESPACYTSTPVENLEEVEFATPREKDQRTPSVPGRRRGRPPKKKPTDLEFESSGNEDLDVNRSASNRNTTDIRNYLLARTSHDPKVAEKPITKKRGRPPKRKVENFPAQNNYNSNHPHMFSNVTSCSDDEQIQNNSRQSASFTSQPSTSKEHEFDVPMDYQVDFSTLRRNSQNILADAEHVLPATYTIHRSPAIETSRSYNHVEYSPCKRNESSSSIRRATESTLHVPEPVNYTLHRSPANSYSPTKEGYSPGRRNEDLVDQYSMHRSRANVAAYSYRQANDEQLALNEEGVSGSVPGYRTSYQTSQSQLPSNSALSQCVQNNESVNGSGNVTPNVEHGQTGKTFPSSPMIPFQTISNMAESSPSRLPSNSQLSQSEQNLNSETVNGSNLDILGNGTPILGNGLAEKNLPSSPITPYQSNMAEIAQSQLLTNSQLSQSVQNLDNLSASQLFETSQHLIEAIENSAPISELESSLCMAVSQRLTLENDELGKEASSANGEYLKIGGQLYKRVTNPKKKWSAKFRSRKEDVSSSQEKESVETGYSSEGEVPADQDIGLLPDLTNSQVPDEREKTKKKPNEEVSLTKSPGKGLDTSIGSQSNLIVEEDAATGGSEVEERDSEAGKEIDDENAESTRSAKSVPSGTEKVVSQQTMDNGSSEGTSKEVPLSQDIFEPSQADTNDDPRNDDSPCSSSDEEEEAAAEFNIEEVNLENASGDDKGSSSDDEQTEFDRIKKPTKQKKQTAGSESELNSSSDDDELEEPQIQGPAEVISLEDEQDPKETEKASGDDKASSSDEEETELDRVKKLIGQKKPTVESDNESELNSSSDDDDFVPTQIQKPTEVVSLEDEPGAKAVEVSKDNQASSSSDEEETELDRIKKLIQQKQQQKEKGTTQEPEEDDDSDLNSSSDDELIAARPIKSPEIVSLDCDKGKERRKSLGPYESPDDSSDDDEYSNVFLNSRQRIKQDSISITDVEENKDGVVDDLDESALWVSLSQTPRTWNMDSPVKKKKKKKKNQDSEEGSQSSEVTDSPAKRGGRPKKNAVEVSTEDSQESLVESPSKKRRNLSKKIIEESTEESQDSDKVESPTKSPTKKNEKAIEESTEESQDAEKGESPTKSPTKKNKKITEEKTEESQDSNTNESPTKSPGKKKKKIIEESTEESQDATSVESPKKSPGKNNKKEIDETVEDSQDSAIQEGSPRNSDNLTNEDEEVTSERKKSKKKKQIDEMEENEEVIKTEDAEEVNGEEAEEETEIVLKKKKKKRKEDREDNQDDVKKKKKKRKEHGEQEEDAPKKKKKKQVMDDDDDDVLVPKKKKKKSKNKSYENGHDEIKEENEDAEDIKPISHLPDHFLQDLAEVKPHSSIRDAERYERKQRKKEERKRVKKELHEDDDSYIPLDASGATKFGAVPLSGVFSAAREKSAANFKQKMLFGSRIIRSPMEKVLAQKKKRQVT